MAEITNGLLFKSIELYFMSGDSGGGCGLIHFRSLTNKMRTECGMFSLTFEKNLIPEKSSIDSIFPLMQGKKVTF